MIANIQIAEHLHITEPVATIIAALIGAIGGIIGTFFASVLPERRKRPRLIADFLEAIAGKVTEMIMKFEKDQIPHEAGHALYSLIDFFENATNRRFLGTMALETLNELRKLSQEAETVDMYLYSGQNGKSLREAWETKARGIVGELHGEAAKLRAG